MCSNCPAPCPFSVSHGNGYFTHSCCGRRDELQAGLRSESSQGRQCPWKGSWMQQDVEKPMGPRGISILPAPKCSPILTSPQPCQTWTGWDPQAHPSKDMKEVKLLWWPRHLSPPSRAHLGSWQPHMWLPSSHKMGFKFHFQCLKSYLPFPSFTSRCANPVSSRSWPFAVLFMILFAAKAGHTLTPSLVDAEDVQAPQANVHQSLTLQVPKYSRDFNPQPKQALKSCVWYKHSNSHVTGTAFPIPDPKTQTEEKNPRTCPSRHPKLLLQHHLGCLSILGTAI